MDEKRKKRLHREIRLRDESPIIFGALVEFCFSKLT